MSLQNLNHTEISVRSPTEALFSPTRNIHLILSNRTTTATTDQNGMKNPSRSHIHFKSRFGQTFSPGRANGPQETVYSAGDHSAAEINDMDNKNNSSFRIQYPSYAAQEK